MAAAISTSIPRARLFCHIRKFTSCRKKADTYESSCVIKNKCTRIPSVNFVRQLSEKQTSEPSRLTESILQNRLAQDVESELQQQKKVDEDKKERKGKWTKKTWALATAAVMGSATGVLLVYKWGYPLTDMEGNLIPDEYSNYFPPFAYIMRTYKEIFVQVKIVKEPSRDKLLPDPLRPPYMQPKYTLVLEMTDVLVHPEWSYGTGWRFKKRPGISHFLSSIGPPLFEVVIYTKEAGMTADPIITQIDPGNYIMYRLYRDATRYEDGIHIKDLNCLNRDLSKVIMVDWNKNAVRLNTDNLLTLKKWTGDKDVVLGELADFLKALAFSQINDVRPVLQYYSQFEDPLVQFQENQKKLLEEQRKNLEIVQKRESRNLMSLWRGLRT